jgi:hypothetical protein
MMKTLGLMLCDFRPLPVSPEYLLGAGTCRWAVIMKFNTDSL